MNLLHGLTLMMVVAILAMFVIFLRMSWLMLSELYDEIPVQVTIFALVLVSAFLIGSFL